MRASGRVCGIVRFTARDERPRDKAFLREIARTAASPFALDETPRAIFLQTAVPAWREPSTASAILCAGRAFLHNGAEVARQFRQSTEAGPVALIRAAFEARHDAGLAILRGTFSFAHWDEGRQQLTLARDCGRGEGLHFFRDRNLVIFASHLPDLLSHPDVSRELDEVTLASQLCGDVSQRRRTVFRGVERVPSRMTVTITRENTEHRVYWQPELAASSLYSRDEDYVERARELLDQAVDRVLSDSPNFAMMASGGLDSSAVLSTLARRGLPSIPCYTYLPEAPASQQLRAGEYPDERPKTNALASMYPALQFHYFSASDLRAQARPDVARFERWPVPLSNISNGRITEPIYRAMAADGFHVVLTGTAGNFGLSWSGDDLLPTLAAKGRLVTLLREAYATARYQKSDLLRTLVHEAVLPLFPPSAKEALLRLLGQAPHLIDSRSPLRPEKLKEFNLRQLWRENGFNPNPRWVRHTRKFRIERLFDRPFMIHDRGPAFDSLYGIEMRDPLADRDLVEFCLNVPERLYRRNGVARWFARAVLADRVPPEIGGERRRGSQHMPWFAELESGRSDMAAEIERMENSVVASRLFDIPRLKQLLNAWPKDAEAIAAQDRAYMALDQAVYVFRFMRWMTRGNA